MGRQVHLEVGGDDFYIDLLFYHLILRCYVVVELKARDFQPGDISQLNMYQNVVNDVLRHPDDKPTIGLLLVKGKNKTVVEYSLEGYTNPIGVADWKNQLSEAIPDDLKSSLPTIEEIEREMEFAESQLENQIDDAGDVIECRHQPFQADAAKVVCDVFAGQMYHSSTYMIDSGLDADVRYGQAQLSKDGFTGFNNAPIRIDDNTVLENIRAI